MNHTLNALFTKLKWQLLEVGNKLLSIEQHIERLDQELHLNQQKISRSCIMPALIFPEKEIARSHFLTRQQQQQIELMNNKATLQSSHQVLMDQQTCLNMELKMLERHQETQLRHQQQQTWLKEQNNSDEWVLQKRGLK